MVAFFSIELCEKPFLISNTLMEDMTGQHRVYRAIKLTEVNNEYTMYFYVICFKFIFENVQQF